MKKRNRIVARFVAMALTSGSWVGSALAGGTSTGLIPLTQLSGQYQGFEGGLYPGGGNTLPSAHLAAGLSRAAQVQPRDPAGNPDPNGWIVMISVGMSNTTHEFGAFERQEDANPNRNARLIIINGAHGGQTASAIRDPGAPYWQLIDERLNTMGLARPQVQVVWLKEANANPPNDFPGHAQALSQDLRAVVQVLKDRFPNVQICYLSSRIYGGYAAGGLNPEPQAYEGAFSVKWLIQDQINGAADLNFDPAAGVVEAPWLAWGPYLWADGLTPRASDGLIWVQADLESDGTHPSGSGEQKVADITSGFFHSDSTAAPWYSARPGLSLRVIDAAADVHVSQAQPSQNFGSASALLLAGGASASNVYLKFDVSSVVEPILLAKLSFRAGGSGSARAMIHTVDDDSWMESAVNWNNAPAVSGAPLVTTGTISRDGSISANVTPAVLSDPDRIVSFRLSTTTASANGYISKEGGQPPRLILVVQSAAGPGSIPTVSSLGVFSLALLLVAWGSIILRRGPRPNLPG